MSEQVSGRSLNGATQGADVGRIVPPLGLAAPHVSAKREDSSVGALIRYAKETKTPWTIENLWQEGGIAVIHSLEGEFKSVLTYQIAEVVAAGSKLLRLWNVPQGRRTGIFETEMDDLEVGKRLASMYPREDWPRNLEVSDGALLKEFRRRPTFEEKLDCIATWIREKRLEVLAWDTVNSILAVCGDPNSERGVSKFLEGIAQLPAKGILIVRHDVKPSRDSVLRSSNQLVRGSNRIVEDASVVIHLQRKDKATNKVIMEIGKLRNAPLPEPVELWFDAGTFRLTPLPPLVALLEYGPLSRPDLLTLAERRFNLKWRAVDEHRHGAGFVNETMEGHRRILSLNYDFIPEPGSDEAKWWNLVRKPGAHI